MWPLRVRLALVAALLLAFPALRLFLALTEPLTPGQQTGLKERARHKLAFVEHPPGPDTAGRVYMLGASEAEVAFDALRFDAAPANRAAGTFAVNLAIRDAGHFFPLYARRVRRSIEASGAKAKLVAVSVSVSRLTKRSQAWYARQEKIPDVWSVYFTKDFLTDPSLNASEKLELAVNKYALGERSLLQAPAFFSGALGAVVPWLRLRGIFSQALYDLERTGLRNSTATGLARLRRPFYGGLGEESAELLRVRAELDNERFRQHYLRMQQIQHDFFGLAYDPDYLGDVAKAVSELKAVAETVVLVDFPESPLTGRSAESQARRNEGFERLAAEAGVELWRAPQLPAADFVDPVHPSPRGSARLTDFLASRVPWAGAAQN